MTLNCHPTPHVQTMLTATDSVGMSLLLDPDLATTRSLDADMHISYSDPAGLTPCYAGHDEAVSGEIGTTGLIRVQGYDVDVLMTSFSSERDVDAYCRVNGEAVDDVLFEGGYFGHSVHPYELLFAKTGRDVTPELTEHLTEWHLREGRNSWDMCGTA
jgi:hypothetical protein